MAFLDELYFAPAHKLLSMLLAREVSSTELTRAFYERISKVNPRLNAIVTLCEERALREAAESDRRLSAKNGIRPLEGLPITIKECISTEGVRSTDGIRRDQQPVESWARAGRVERWRGCCACSGFLRPRAWLRLRRLYPSAITFLGSCRPQAVVGHDSRFRASVRPI